MTTNLYAPEDTPIACVCDGPLEACNLDGCSNQTSLLRQFAVDLAKRSKQEYLKVSYDQTDRVR